MDTNVKEIAKKLQDRLIEKGLLPIGISGRHVHLTKEQVAILFGHDLTIVKELTQPGQFLYKERVNIRYGDKVMKNIAILGPCRDYWQVELSTADARKLGVNAPFRLSGDTEGTPGITVFTDNASMDFPNGVIIAKRHVHMSEAEAKKFNLKKGDLVDVKVLSDRSLVFENVELRIHNDFVLEMHVDVDEGNSAGLSNDMAFGVLILKKGR